MEVYFLYKSFPVLNLAYEHRKLCCRYLTLASVRVVREQSCKCKLMNSGDMATVRKSQALPKWLFLAAVTIITFLHLRKTKHA